MLYIPKIDECLEILSDEEVKDFVAINFRDYFNSIKEEKNLRKASKSLYIFRTKPGEVEKYMESNCSGNCLCHYNVEILNIFDPELQLTDTKLVNKKEIK